jgi:hypothetical protein
MKKTMVVLANSVKRNGRCLAGKELVRDRGGWKAGDWIRPVSKPDGGEVSVEKMKAALGHEPKLLEIVEIPLASPVPLPDQPENWLIDANGLWRSIEVMPWEQVHLLIDRPPQVWDEGRGWRRVSKGYPRRMPHPASLYLIKPQEIVTLEVWSEPHPRKPAPALKRHRLAKTRYAGVVHEFDITDPSLADRYFPSFPAVKDGRREITLHSPIETLICVSLTPEFEDTGYHYKIAAAFIEPPAKS